MSYFVNKSWQLLQKILTYDGVWPNQNRVQSYLIRTIQTVALILAIIPALIPLRSGLEVDREMVVVNISGILIATVTFTKIYVSCMYNERKSKFYEKVNDHFRTITDPGESFAMNKFSKKAVSLCAILYMAIYGSVGVIFMYLPTMKMLINLLFFGGEFERVLPYHADYGPLNKDEYYVVILIHIFVYCSFVFITNYAFDFAYIMKVRHTCALFEIVQNRLRDASGFLEDFEWNILDCVTANNRAIEFIIKAIDLHNEAMKMVSMIEKAYNFSLLVILIQNWAVFSGGVFLVYLNLYNPLECLRFLSIFCLFLLHFFEFFSHGQMIIDYSSSVFDACYDVKWYVSSKKVKTLLFIMMSRSLTPCVITAGGLFTISMETYCKMMKAGLSYFSVFTQ